MVIEMLDEIAPKITAGRRVYALFDSWYVSVERLNNSLNPILPMSSHLAVTGQGCLCDGRCALCKMSVSRKSVLRSGGGPPALQGAMSLKQRVWQILEVDRAGDRLSRAFDIFIISLIALNGLAFVFGTVEDLASAFGSWLDAFERFSIVVFTVEYAGRLWSCVTVPAYAGALKGRLRFMFTPLALVDLLAIAPFYLPFVSFDLRFLRLLRLFRVFRIFKLARYMESLQLLGRVFVQKKEELATTLVVLIVLLIFAASFMYYAEHDTQPRSFPDIPSAMWWAVATLTTVGYGDVYPVSPLGRLLGAVVAILGIGLFALPTAILGSGFLEELQKKRKAPSICPHCGKPLE